MLTAKEIERLLRALERLSIATEKVAEQLEIQNKKETN